MTRHGTNTVTGLGNSPVTRNRTRVVMVDAFATNP
jgi:hypothetical protein